MGTRSYSSRGFSSYGAPPLIGGYGGFGYGFPMFAPPIFIGGGGLFQLFFLFFAVRFVLSFLESLRDGIDFDRDDDDDIFD
mmetsp:Transcript_4435/g.11517  ORF Transcript_4435/g.11517 Transcript_4435/m.11517 type:complete len:81 (-) Transcript_4435:90-332(-)